MPARILDTEVLISHYRKMTQSKSVHAVKAHARRLINIEQTNWILSPIRIEFLCGARDSNEFKLYSAYLELFEVFDKRIIPSQDWSEAERLAQWVKEGGRSRKLGDCLIQAIARRLHAEVITRDQDFRLRTLPSQS
jgi:predicted nucleic acid-binding protein